MYTSAKIYFVGVIMIVISVVGVFYTMGEGGQETFNLLMGTASIGISFLCIANLVSMKEDNDELRAMDYEPPKNHFRLITVGGATIFTLLQGVSSLLGTPLFNY